MLSERLSAGPVAGEFAPGSDPAGRAPAARLRVRRLARPACTWTRCAARSAEVPEASTPIRSCASPSAGFYGRARSRLQVRGESLRHRPEAEVVVVTDDVPHGHARPDRRASSWSAWSTASRCATSFQPSWPRASASCNPKPRSGTGPSVRHAGRAGRRLARQQAAPAAAPPTSTASGSARRRREDNAVRFREAGGACGKTRPLSARHPGRTPARSPTGHLARRVFCREAHRGSSLEHGNPLALREVRRHGAHRMLDRAGRSIFGAIEQRIERHAADWVGRALVCRGRAWSKDCHRAPGASGTGFHAGVHHVGRRPQAVQLPAFQRRLPCAHRAQSEGAAARDRAGAP